MIIGFSGRLGVGKDYIAQNLILPFIESKFPTKRCIPLAFADQLKINTIIKYNVPFQGVFVKKTKETRRLLQMEGTEIGRQMHGKDIWIKYMNNWIQTWKSRGFTTFLITDCRFKNEIDWIHSQGGIVIRISAPRRSKEKLLSEFGEVDVTVTKHISESELDTVDHTEYDFVFDNDSDSDSHRDQLLHFIKSQIYEDDKKSM